MATPTPEHPSTETAGTHRPETEAALLSTAAKFEAILAIAADAIISVDERMRIVHFNHGAERIFGYAQQEAMGQSLDMLLPERFRRAHTSHVHMFGRGPDDARRMAERREIYGLRRSGEEFPAEASISRLDTPEGRLYTVVLRDISERKRAETNQRFLATAGDLFARSLELETTIHTVVQLPVEHLADGCILDLVERGGRIRRYVSESADAALEARLRRVEREFTLTWDSPSRVIDVLQTGRPELVPTLTFEWLEAHVETAEQMRLEREMERRSLIIVPLIAREAVIGAMSLFTVGARGRHFDAVDLHVALELGRRAAFAIDNARLYREAQRATRARDEILGVVSHDLRNPLSAIAMVTRALRDQLAPDDPRRELLDTAYDSTEWMNRLIQDLLDVASIEAGRLAVERRPEAVTPLLERAAAMFERTAADRSLIVRVTAPAGLPSVVADAERVLQVLANLLGNAVKFTEPGGAITVSAEPLDGEVAISVIDSGVGIPPEHLPHIFERYWYARRTAHKRGSGLGLAIAKGIVEAHNGRLWVKSTLGSGSTFTFTLPRADDPRVDSPRA